MNNAFRRRPAGNIFLLIEAGQAFIWAVTFTLGLVYQIKVAHLDPFQLVLIGTILEASCFLAEIPTGVVADLRSRRLSVIIGVTMLGVGVLITSVPLFWTIAIGNVVWGVGYTFTSGATEAWLADEVGEDHAQRWFTSATQWNLVMTIAGILAGGVLGKLSLQLPLLVGGGLFLALAVVLVILMPEDNFSPVPSEGRGRGAQMLATLKLAVGSARAVPVVRSFLIISLLAGITSEVFDRLWADLILKEFPLPFVGVLSDEASWFTLFALVGSAVSLLASRVANRHASAALNAEHPSGVMAGMLLGQILCVAGFALVPWLWLALGFRWLRQALMVLAAPVRSAWLNRNVDSEARATTLSAMSQADALGQVFGGPSFGSLAKLGGVPLALVVSAAVQLPAVGVMLRIRRGESSGEQAR